MDDNLSQSRLTGGKAELSSKSRSASFEENLFSWVSWLDDSVELSQRRFARDLRATRHWLAQAKPGTYVLTYNGLGGNLPPSYRPLRVARDLPCVLKLWQQQAHW